MKTKEGRHVPSSPVWGVSCASDGLAARRAEVRALAGTLAGLPVLPGERQSLAAECESRGAVAAQALAGRALALERSGDGPVRAGQAPPGPVAQGQAGDDENRDDRFADVWRDVAAWGTGKARGRLDGVVVAAVWGAFASGAARLDDAGLGRDAPAAGDAASAVAPEGSVAALIEAFAAWYNGPDLGAGDPVVRAAAAHCCLASLRSVSRAFLPTALAAESLVLDTAEYRLPSRLLPEYYLSHVERYARVLPEQSSPPRLVPPDGALAEPFLTFWLDGLIWALREVERRVADGLRRLALERHYEELRQARRVTPRQHALLRLLLDAAPHPVGIRALCRASPFSLLYGRASEQTARRDLKRLSGMGLLAAASDGFVLNREALCG